jgi:hypothetical protein
MNRKALRAIALRSFALVVVVAAEPVGDLTQLPLERVKAGRARGYETGLLTVLHHFLLVHNPEHDDPDNDEDADDHGRIPPEAGPAAPALRA